MMKFTLIILSFLLISCSREQAGHNLPEPVVENKIKDQWIPADPGKVHFRGMIGEEMDRVLDQRILSEFARKEIITEATRAFREKKDDQYLAQGEKRGIWQGEFWGKWILSAIEAYRYTGNKDLLETIRLETMDLISTQREDGYIGTYANSGLVEGNVWNVWCRKYTLWGLVETYRLLGDPVILEAACRHMDHLMTEVGPGKVEMVRTGNFYGLPSSSILGPLTILYTHTGNKNYLDYAGYIIENWNLEPGSPPDLLNKGLEGDPVHRWFPEAGRWTKAYEFISCVEGMMDMYRLEGKETLLQAAVNIYDVIARHERNLAGGIGYHDKLVDAAGFVEGLYEPCDVVYWERLSAKLLALTGEAKYADEIERLMYNTLLGTFNDSGDWAVRRMGLNEPHLVAPLHCYLKHHQCCVANIPRGMLQLTEVAIMASAEEELLNVNLYIPGDYKISLPSGKTMALEVDTRYPADGEVRIRVRNKKALRAGLNFRKPEWCPEEDFEIFVNEKLQPDGKGLAGKWSEGDEILLKMAMPLRMLPHPDSAGYFALMRGPLLLARSSLLEGGAIDDPFRLPADPAVMPVAHPDQGIRMSYELALPNGDKIRLIDYASSGRDFTKPQDPFATREMLRNRVGSDQRVWFRQP